MQWPTAAGLSIAIGMWATMVGGESTPDREGPEPIRNVVFLCVDTLRADHLGAYGYARPTTPTIDGLAAEGVLIEHATSHAPWTLPATVSLLSSQYPSRHGAEISGPNKHLDEEPVRDIRDDVSILSDTLREAGFETALFSANPYLGGKLERRFDHAIVNRQPTPALNAKALAWLDQLEGRRFFMHLQYMDLHQPIRPPKQYFNMFPISDATRRGKAHTVWPRRFTRVTNPSDPRFKSFRNHKIALYDGALRYVDGEIGKFLAALRERGLRSQTLFVITSDHGEEFWEHAEIERALGGDPRKIWGVAHGHSMFQELLSVPLIFAGPRVPSGRRLSCPAGHIDVVPTVLELLGLPRSSTLRGVSLVPQFRSSDPANECAARPLFAESPAYGPASESVLFRGWKLIRRSDGAKLLFDLNRDRKESKNVVSSPPRGLMTELSDLLESERAGSAHLEDAETREFDPETLDQLRVLGYIE